MNELVVLSILTYEQAKKETSRQDKSILTASSFREAANIAEATDKLAYYNDDRCENPTERIEEFYGDTYGNRGVFYSEIWDAADTLTKYRVIVPVASQLAVYVRYFVDTEPTEIDPVYADMIHEYVQS